MLGNLSKFGQKEPWMEPMNKFLVAAAPEFRKFIEEFCSWKAVQGPHHEPQYQAASQVKLRLPPLSREGLPTLPYLLDAPGSLATLVDLWTKHAPANIGEKGVDDCVRIFHNQCLELQQRTNECMAEAERAQEPNSKLERQWQKMLSEQQQTQIARNPFDEVTYDRDITALPRTINPHNQNPQPHYHQSGYGAEDNSSTIDEDRGDGEFSHRSVTRPMSNSTNSSSVSFDVFDEYRSREGFTRGRFLDSSAQRTGRSDHAASEDITGRI